MKCEEAIGRIPAYVLDELDVEVRHEAAAHFEACGACRGELERHERAVGAMRRLSDVETSAARRENTLAAMIGARDELVERAMMRRPVRWPLRAATAAAVAIAAITIGWATLLPNPAWRVTALRGGARLTRRGEESFALRVNDRVKPVDIVSILDDGAVTLEAGDGRIEMSGMTSVEVRGYSNVILINGSLRAESRGELTVANAWSDRVVLRGGSAVLASDLGGEASAVNGENEPKPAKVHGDRFRVHVESGQADLVGAVGNLLLEAGQSARLDRRGKPTD